MINKENVILKILESCPSFADSWNEFEEKSLLYVAMGNLARHALHLHSIKNDKELISLGELIEEFHLNGNDYVKELATIGILEGIQNVWGNSKVNPCEFERYLLPESLKWWNSLKRFWDKEIPYVGADIMKNNG